MSKAFLLKNFHLSPLQNHNSSHTQKHFQKNLFHKSKGTREIFLFSPARIPHEHAPARTIFCFHLITIVDIANAFECVECRRLEENCDERNHEANFGGAWRVWGLKWKHCWEIFFPIIFPPNKNSFCRLFSLLRFFIFLCANLENFLLVSIYIFSYFFLIVPFFFCLVSR